MNSEGRQTLFRFSSRRNVLWKKNPVLIQLCCGSPTKKFCEERGYKILSDNNLGQELKRLGIERKRKRQEGIRGYVYEGLMLLSGGVPSCP